VLVFELINAETRFPKGIAGLFLAGDISGRWRAQDFSMSSPSMADNARSDYLTALRAADKDDYSLLLVFVRSTA
jgi:hypothetical protein